MPEIQEPPLRILILTDNPARSSYLEGELHKHQADFSVAVAVNRTELTEQLVEFKPDMVLVDGETPKLLTEEVVRLARNICPQATIVPVVPGEEAELRRTLIRIGADGTIPRDNMHRLASALTGAIFKRANATAEKLSRQAIRERLEQVEEMQPMVREIHAFLLGEQLVEGGKKGWKQVVEDRLARLEWVVLTLGGAASAVATVAATLLVTKGVHGAMRLLGLE